MAQKSPSHRRDAPLPEIAARVAASGAAGLAFSGGLRPGPPPAATPLPSFHRSWRQSLLERCQSVRQHPQKLPLLQITDGASARDAASLLDAVHPECPFYVRYHLDLIRMPSTEHVAAQPGGDVERPLHLASRRAGEDFKGVSIAAVNQLFRNSRSRFSRGLRVPVGTRGDGERPWTGVPLKELLAAARIKRGRCSSNSRVSIAGRGPRARAPTWS